MPRPIFAYVSGAAETGRALAGNREAFDAFALVPSMLVDTSARDPGLTLFGQRFAQPFGIAPLGAAATAAFEADRALAGEASAAGIPMVLSGASLVPMERIAEAAPGAWFQMYVPGDRAAIGPLMDRVGRAGFRTLVLTVDFPVPGNREHYIRNGYAMPMRPSLGLAWQGVSHPRWLVGTLARTLRATGMPHLENLAGGRSPVFARTLALDRGRRDRLTWDDLAWMRTRWSGTLLVKGLLASDDAKRARDAGADGIVVSNHGGRQLDRAVAPLTALPGIVAAVPDLPVLIDGGLRRGTDVLIALALGARLVLIGRPFLYAAAVGGRAGIARAIGLLAAEIDRDMALLGCRTLDELGPRHLVRTGLA